MVPLKYETIVILNKLKDEGMFLSRFVERVLDAFLKDDRIIAALVQMKEPMGLYHEHRSVTIKTEVVDALRTISSLSGMPQNRIAAKCVVHGLAELQAGMPFGSSLGEIK